MYVLYLLILLKVVNGQDSDESKYIDLLTDTEKEEFLESVARRISEKVVVKNISTKTSLEIPDEDLNVHDAFVKQILKEEYNNRRENKNLATNSKENKDIAENIQVEPIKKYPEKYNDTTTAPSLSTKKLKRRDIDTEKTSEIPVEVITERVQYRNIEVIAASTTVTDLPLTHENTTTLKYYNNATELGGIKTNVNSTQFEYHLNNKSENNIMVDDTGIVNITDRGPQITSVQPEQSKGVTVQEAIIVAQTDDVSANHPISPTIAPGNKTVFLRSNFTNEPSEYITNLSDTDKHGSNNTHTPKNNTPYVVNDIIYSKKVDEVAFPNKIIDEVKNSTSPTNISGVVETLTSVANVAEKAINLLRSSLLLLDEDIDTEKIDSNINLKTNDYVKNPKGNIRTYEVREIRKDQSPFIKASVALTQNPYHVPVYNYSLNNAYYNPKNRYGPTLNEDINKSYNDFNNKFLSKKYNDNFSKKKYFLEHHVTVNGNETPETYKNRIIRKKQSKSFDTPNTLNYFITWPLSYKKKISTSNVYNPNDYLDLDYSAKSLNYRGRMGSDLDLPDSDEESHPYNSIRKNLTNHVRAVRNILYNKNIFLYNKPLPESKPMTEPTINSPVTDYEMSTVTDDKSDEIVTQDIKPELDSSYFRSRSDSDNISLDYYFGRMTPKEKVMNIFFKNEGNDNYVLKNDDKLIQYVQKVQFKDDPYYDHHKIAATQHTDLKFEENNPNTIYLDYSQSANRKTATEEKNASEHFSTISNILDIANEVDVFIVLEQLINLNLSLSRRQKDAYLNVYLKVLKDLVRTDDKAVKQYDWLGTTVDILSALRKLIELTESVQKEGYIHPSDLELLKFMVLFHQLSEESVDGGDVKTKLRTLLPRNRNRKRHFLTDKGLINRVWLLRRNASVDDCLNTFKSFLVELRNSLNDFHDAILNIAQVTRFSNQNWYENIKELYLTSENKPYIEILLHLVSARLFSLVEDSATQGLEKDFVTFLLDNKQSTIKILTEFIYVKRILNEIKGS